MMTRFIGPICIIAIALVFGSCRKEILHEPGFQSNLYPYWQKKVRPNVSQERYIDAVVFDGELYFAGTVTYGDPGDENYGMIVKIDSAGNFINIIEPEAVGGGGSGSPSVRAMHAHNNELFVGGWFDATYNGNTFYDLMKYDTNDSLSSAGFPDMPSPLSWINDLGSYAGNLMVVGNFPGNNTDAVRQLNNGAFEVFCFPPSFTPFYGTEIDNEFWITGENNGMASADAIATNWTDQPYNESYPGEEVYNIMRHNGYDYVVASGGLKIRNVNTGSWIDQPWPSGYSDYQNLYNDVEYFSFKVINGDVYLLTKGVYKLDNSGTWQPLGRLNVVVHGLEFFNGKYYAATERGIFEFVQ